MQMLAERAAVDIEELIVNGDVASSDPYNGSPLRQHLHQRLLKAVFFNVIFERVISDVDFGNDFFRVQFDRAGHRCG